MAFAVAAVVVIALPAAAFGLLTNSYGMSFDGTHTAGGNGCQDCHGDLYSQTAHGAYVQWTTIPSDPGMWPAGRPGLGNTVSQSQIAFTIYGSPGLISGALGDSEYVAASSAVTGTYSGPFAMVNGLEWDASAPNGWEIGNAAGAASGLSFGNYTCSQCHQLGVTRVGVKPAAGNFSGSALATVDAWARDPSTNPSLTASYMQGSGIQCERCHGTGVAAGSIAAGEHWSSGVQIVGWDTTSTNPNARAASQKVLDSQTCGQCHGTFKSGNIVGFTPDATITDFVGSYGPTDVPTVASFTVSPGSYKFYPTGHDKQGGLKHSYYSEWAMSPHSWRGHLTSSSPNATPYQKYGWQELNENAANGVPGKVETSHFSESTNGSVVCNKCHTGEGYMKRKGVAIIQGLVESTSTEGFLGTECSSCHVAHGASTTTGMAIRQPEQAFGPVGTSTNGLGISNKSICEDCHNWQLEVQGLPLTVTSSLSHPQREIYHGRAFFEVPQMPDFMPGVRCEECHMPATYSDTPSETTVPRYDNENYKRYSHTFLIMEPGQATSWGVLPAADSCSPCHTGESQSQLQGNLATWFSTAKTLNTQLTTALAAAKSRPETQTAGGLYLFQAATKNQSMYTADESLGAHNPPYEQAALTKSAFLANEVGGTFANAGVLSGPSTVTTGSVNFISGGVNFGDGSPAAGASLTLLANNVPVAATTADVNGAFSFMITPSATTSYQVRWERSSQTSTYLFSTTKTVTIAGAPTTITISSSTGSVAVNHQFILSGLGTPSGLIGLNMHVDVKKPGSSHFSYSSARTFYNSGGNAAWQYKYTPLLTGTYQFRAIWDGNASFAPSQSGLVLVSVH
jgi:hypothetical protein